MRQEPEQFLPSTTRAVAWGALFFSLLAFFISAVTLFLTWRDGRLVHGARQFTDGMSQFVERVRQDRPGQESNRQWDDMRERLDRVQEMIRQGDASARYYLDNIRQDLDEWRKDPRWKDAAWLAESPEKLRAVREGIARDAPGAAQRLKEITGDLHKKIQALGKTTEPSENPQGMKPERSSEARMAPDGGQSFSENR